MLEIVPLKNANQIITFMTLEDNIESFIKGTKTEWIQFLSKVVVSKDYLILAILIDKKLEGYCVCTNNVYLPLSDHITMIFISDLRNRFCDDGADVSEELFKLIKKWAKLKGASSIKGITRFVRMAQDYGFGVDKERIVSLEV